MLMTYAIAGALGTAPGPGEFGLVPGTVHTYLTVSGKERPKRETTRVVGQSNVQGMDVFDVKLENGRHEFYGVSPEGLFEFFAANMEGTKVDKSTKPTPLYLRAKRSGESWEWVEPFRGQMMSGPGDKVPDMDDLTNHCRAKLVSRIARVKTPAGEYTAVMVSIHRSSKALGESTEGLWIAQGKGIVKRVVAHSNWRSETVMVD